MPNRERAGPAVSAAAELKPKWQTQAENNARTSAYLWILAAFAISRVLYALAGVRFQTELVHKNFQFIDVALMQNRLLESLYYYHMQPPLHNLITGLVVKFFPGNYGGALHAWFMLVGLVCAFLMFELLRILGASVRLSCILTIVFITSPGCVLFENFPMYEYLIMALLLGQCVALYRFLRRPSFGKALLFFCLLAAAAYIRATYHLYILIAITAGLAWYLRGHRALIAKAALLPLLVVFLLYAKNYALFGVFGGSSWLGNNMPTVTTHNLTPEECKSLVDSGKLIAFGCVEGSGPPDLYRPWFPALKKTGIPVLDDEVKSSGDANFNHLIYLKTGPMYAIAAKQVIRSYPAAYLRSVVIAWFCYFRPPSDFFQFDENRAPIRTLERAYDLILFGELRQAPGKELRAIRAREGTASLLMYTGVFMIVAVPLILVAAAYYLFSDWRSGYQPVLIAFVLFQILLVALSSNFLSSFENNRYRFPTDPLYIALAGFLIARMWTRTSSGEPSR